MTSLIRSGIEEIRFVRSVSGISYRDDFIPFRNLSKLFTAVWYQKDEVIIEQFRSKFHFAINIYSSYKSTYLHTIVFIIAFVLQLNRSKYIKFRII